MSKLLDKLKGAERLQQPATLVQPAGEPLHLKLEFAFKDPQR